MSSLLQHSECESVSFNRGDILKRSSKPRQNTVGSMRRRERIAACALSLAALLSALSAPAQSPITVTVDLSKPGPVIPDDFIGLSYETQQVMGSHGEHTFSASNSALIRTFKLLGVRSLRIGGNTADTGPIPSTTDVDDLFAFAKSAGVKVIFTLKLKNSTVQDSASLANYITKHYASDLTCFSIGNEPTTYIKSFSAYESLVKSYMRGVTPKAKFCGADVEDKGQWAYSYAEAFTGSSNIALVTEHHYLGSGRNRAGVVGRDEMLSHRADGSYTDFFNGFGSIVSKEGFSFRLSETNSFFHGGATDASDTFASALWGLDYLHWWAAHGAAGVNFHTGDTVSSQVGGPNKPAIYAVFVSSRAGYHINPLGYGIKAFDVGSHGTVVPVTIDNPESVNLAAYGVVRGPMNLYVTLINKEHDTSAHSAKVTVVADSSYSKATTIFLRAPENNVSATEGVTLGGESIGDEGLWDGRESEPSTVSQGKFTLDLPPATAVIVHLE